MSRSRAHTDEGLVPEIGLRLERGRVRQPRFAILRCAKLKKPANIAASLQHTFRERETPNADLKRRHDNTILLGPDTSEAVLDAWRDRAPEKIRANAVHGLEYFIGASPEAMHAMSRAEQDAYFRDALDWLKERHGADNILSAVVHRDESTPHMTVMTIPLDEHGKLNARALVGNRHKLSAMQTDFAKEVGLEHGLERGLERSQATHERVQRVYAHIMAPEAAVALPERQKGHFLGLGGESDEDWHHRASEAATDALRGARLALDRQKDRHEALLGILEAQLAHERIKRQEVLSGDLKENLGDLRQENRELREQVSELEDERDEWRDKARQRERHHLLTIERALDFAKAHGIEPDNMAEYLKHGRDLHEKAHELDREKDLDLDLD
ncbi:MobV family relaxase [Paracoccus jeotgali]|uniref:MobV family relaxase n=1 Tax=Paracoccus jeotgali TaxID=2065379 RepID=UPI0028A93B26|nr:MobV family relaxase [Paracoccus jeotgali]